MSPGGRSIGELDVHLFAQGTHRRLWELLGPQPLGGNGFGDGARFSVWAPNAGAVSVVGDWNGWSPAPMVPVEEPDPTGIWTVSAPEARSGHCYKFEVTGADGRTVRKADPMARRTELPPANASVVPSAAAFEWSDHEWMDRRGATLQGSAPLRIYEVHLGSWRRSAADWDALAAELGAYAEELGFTHVELMPIAEHPYGGSWGYQVTGYYAPTARFGEPAGFARFVDAMHARGLGVIVDWVPAHFPRDDWSLGRFDGAPLYEHPDPRRGEHPDWGTFVFDFGRNEVRNFLVANALFWLDEFHVDGLRVDAVASMLYLDYSREGDGWTANVHGGRENLEAIAFLQEANAVVGEEFPDVMMIAEESTAWPGVTRAIDDGGLGFSHKWNLGWMHDSLGYMALDPVYRRHHHSEMTFSQLYAYNERFVLPLSHDEVVHGKGSLLAKMGGDDWQKFAGLRTILAWQWSMPGAPLLFMGGELATWHEWSDAGELPWHLLDHAPHRGVYDLVQAMNRAADRWPALWRRDTDPAGFTWLDADDALHSLFTFIRWDADERGAVVCLANFTPVPRPGYRVGLPHDGAWQVALDTDASAWWGSGHRETGDVASTDEPWQGQPCSAIVDIGPMSMLWLAAGAP